MKRTLKQNIFSALVLSTVLLGGSPAFSCPTIDIPNIPSIIGNAIAAQGVGSTGLEVVKQELLAADTRTGNAGCANGPSNKKTEGKTKTYDYLKANIEKLFESSYIAPQKDVASAEKILKEKFFVSEDDEESPTEKIKNRKAFAAEVAAEAYSLSMQIRPLYQEDMQSLGALTGKGCNQTQSNAMLNRNLKAQIKMLAAQIIMQIVQMEVDAVQQFIKEPTKIITTKREGAKK